MRNSNSLSFNCWTFFSKSRTFWFRCEHCVVLPCLLHGEVCGGGDLISVCMSPEQANLNVTPPYHHWPSSPTEMLCSLCSYMSIWRSIHLPLVVIQAQVSHPMTLFKKVSHNLFLCGLYSSATHLSAQIYTKVGALVKLTYTVTTTPLPAHYNSLKELTGHIQNKKS